MGLISMGRDVTDTPLQRIDVLVELEQHTQGWTNDQELSPLGTRSCPVPLHMPCRVPVEPTRARVHEGRL